MKSIDIQQGDIITYRKGGINYVNKPSKYREWFDKDLINKEWRDLKIVRIQRYVKCLWFYKLKTIYERKKGE